MSVPTNLIPTLITGLQEYTGSSTLGYMPYILDGRTYKVQFANIAAVGAVPSSRVIAAGTGLAGGGDLSANRVISIANGGVGFDQLALSGVTQGTYGSGSAIPILTVDAKGRVTSATTAPLDVTGFVPNTRTITAGDGLTGGGALTSNVTLAANFSAATPSALGTASAGTAITVSRGDHVHPAVNLSDTSQTQGALPLGRGGTGDALSPVAGAVVYSTGSKFALTNPGIVGQVLVSGGTDEPQWQTVLGTGTVTSVSVSTANGFAGFVANPATVPDITLSTTVTGMLKGDGTGMSAATAGVDYVEPGPYTTSGLTMASARLLGRTTASVGAAQEITVGTGLTLSGGSLINAAPDQTVSLTAGTAISISGTYPSFTITNTAPDQVVSLTGAGTTTVTGTYPSFTITSNDSTSGTVTSVNASGGTTGMSFTGGPVTSAGTLTLNGTLAVANGGTGATDAATALTNLGAYPASNPAGYTTNVGTVTSVSGTGTVSGLTLSGTVTTSGSLTLGGTLSVTPSNFSSQTANTFLAAPNGAAGVPTFRNIVAADVPTLNQNTTGTASNVTGIVAVANGGTGASVAGTARTNLGAAASGANTDITSIALTTGTISTSPVSGTDIVNKLYADSIASGINFHQSVRLATAAALPANTYDNGTSGVGATLTANANGALSVDGVAAVVGNRILVKNEATQANNGVYTVTQVGNGSTPYILTRATDFDSAGTGVDQIDAGDFFLVTAGSTQSNTSWVQQTPLPITVGTTALVFTQFAAPVLYSAGTGLTLAGTVFSITNTGVTASTYGSASSVPVIAVNAQGQATSVTNTSIAIAASQITSGTVTVAQGGTGATTLSSGYVLKGNGTSAVSASVIYDDGTNVGIGTTSLSDKLTVQGSGNFRVSSGNVGIALSGSGWSYSNYFNAADNSLRWYSSTGGDRLALDSNGNLGLNTTTPAGRLSVVSGSSAGAGTAAWSGNHSVFGPNAGSTTGAAIALGYNTSIDAAELFALAPSVAWKPLNIYSNQLTFNTSSGGYGASLNGSGSFTAGGDVRAPIFYDSNNTAFFVDPAGGSRLSAVYVTGGDVDPSNIGAGVGIGNIYEPATSFAAYGVAFGSGAGQHGAIVYGSNIMYFGTENGSDNTMVTKATLNSSGIFIASGDVRAPIFYDADNTSYYVDPAGTSNLVGLTVANTITGNAATATNLSTNRTNWVTNGTLSAVVGQLGWKNYGNNHTIFDASASTSPSGSAVNNTNADVAWGGTYPTLMGWNGVNTYGVRVDSARVADSAGAVDFNSLTNKTGGTGTYTTSGDFRAPIFYDSDNTAFFLDPSSTSVLNVMRANNIQFSSGNEAITLTNGSYSMLRDPTANVALYLGGADPANYYDNSTHYFRTRGGGSNMAVMNGNGIQAPVFYDINNTAYYIDAASTSNLFNLTISGTGNKYLVIQSNDSGEAMVRYLGATGPGWYVGKRTSASLVDTASFHFYSESAGATVAGIDVSGNMLASGSMRAPIFYDSNNTGYYFDGAGTSVANIFSIIGGLFVSDNNNDPYGKVAVTRATGSNYTYYGLTRSGQMVYGMGIDTSNQFWIGGSTAGADGVRSGSPYFYLQTNGNVFASGAFLAPIFYDSNDTAFYADMAGTSNFNQINLGDSTKFIRGGGSGQTILGVGSVNDAYLQVGGSYYSIWNAGNFTPGNYLPLTGGTLTGNLTLSTGTPTITFSSTTSGRSSAFGMTDAYNMYLNAPSGGILYLSNFQAPIMYDRDNSGYYVDPASGSTLGGQLNQYGYLNIAYGGSAYAGMGISNTYASASNFATSFIDFTNESNRQKASIFGNLGTDGSGYLQFLATAAGVARNVDSRTTVGYAYSNQWQFLTSSGITANIYYDQNNTGYYIDAAGTSTLYRTNGDGFSATQFLCGTTNYGDVKDGSTWYGIGRSTVTGWTPGGMVQAAGYTGLRLVGGGTILDIAGPTYGNGWIYSANAMALDNQMRAQIYYDVSNTGYYLDPNGTSLLLNLGLNGGLTAAGAITVGSGDIACYIYMSDSDEGQRILHCNSNRIGFLTQAGGWGSWCDDSGYWLSEASVRAPIFYDTTNTAYYLDFADGGTSNVNTYFTGLAYFRSNFGSSAYSGAQSSPVLQVLSTDAGTAMFSFHRSGYYAVNMGLDPDNVLRIGGWSASANRFQMDMSGNLTMAGNVTAYSDARLKDDVATIPNALDLVGQMRGVTYTRKDTGEAGVGVIAQEMLEVLPQVVQQGIGDDDTLSVAYGNLVGVLIEAIKELTARVAELEGK